MTTTSIFGTDPSLPNYARPDYRALALDLKLIADELGGTRAMHAAAGRYIRKWKAEDKDTYTFRSRCETFFEGLGRTLSAAVGMLFAKPPTVTWNGAETAMKPHWDDVDGAGTAGTVFVKRFAEAAVRDGLGVLLVDHPPAPRGIVVHAGNEVELNLRPTWAMYNRGAAINWRVERLNNRRTLTLLVLHEPATVSDQAYGVKTVHRFRVLRMQSLLELGDKSAADLPVMPYVATWTLWQLNDGAVGDRMDSFTQVGTGVFQNRAGDAAAALPLAIAYTGRTDGIMDARIPLLGVAWANLSHWQLSTELRFNTVVAAFAQPTVIGELADDTSGASPVPGKLKIGPLALVHLRTGGEYRWTEASGTGLARLATLVLEKLGDIARLGLSFLQSDTRAAETAEAKRLDASAENATLATAAQGIEDAVNLALEVHAWYVGIPKAQAPTVQLSRDFENTVMAADVMTAYAYAVEKAGLPLRVLLDSFQRGGRIPADANLDDMELEAVANARADADAKAQAEAEAAAAGAGGGA